VFPQYYTMYAHNSTTVFFGAAVTVDRRVVRPHAVLIGIGLADGSECVLLAIETLTCLSHQVPIQQPSLVQTLFKCFNKAVNVCGRFACIDICRRS
jgi:hypothetical protein